MENLGVCFRKALVEPRGNCKHSVSVRRGSVSLEGKLCRGGASLETFVGKPAKLQTTNPKPKAVNPKALNPKHLNPKTLNPKTLKPYKP